MKRTHMPPGSGNTDFGCRWSCSDVKLWQILGGIHVQSLAGSRWGVVQVQTPPCSPLSGVVVGAPAISVGKLKKEQKLESVNNIVCRNPRFVNIAGMMKVRNSRLTLQERGGLSYY